MKAAMKHQILMQGAIGNNVAEVCKAAGISRTAFYKWKEAYNKHGMAGLAEKPRKPVMPNKVDRKTERLILQHAAKFPEDGPKRIYYELQDEGVKVGETGIYNVLRRHGLTRRAQRELYAAALKERKRQSTGAKDGARKNKGSVKLPDFRMKDPGNARPGYICQQGIFYLGHFPRVGKVYQYVIYDVFSTLGMVKLYNCKSAIHVIEFMHLKVIPQLKTLHFNIENLVTCQSREFTSNWERGKHKYSEFLHKHQINQVTVSAEDHEIFAPLQQFAAVLAEEFYRQAWGDESIDSFAVLEKRLQEYINTYTFGRVIASGPNRGKIPADVALEYTGQRDVLPLWLFTRR